MLGPLTHAEAAKQSPALKSGMHRLPLESSSKIPALQASSGIAFVLAKPQYAKGDPSLQMKSIMETLKEKKMDKTMEVEWKRGYKEAVQGSKYTYTDIPWAGAFSEIGISGSKLARTPHGPVELCGCPSYKCLGLEQDLICV